jgi:hypothetical protein
MLGAMQLNPSYIDEGEAVVEEYNTPFPLTEDVQLKGEGDDHMAQAAAADDKQ